MTSKIDPKDPALAGVFRRGETFWLRWTPAPGKPQKRQSLETDDLAEAIVAAAKLRKQKYRAEPSEGWDAEIARYIAEKRAKTLGQKRHGFTLTTAEKTASALSRFGEAVKWKPFDAIRNADLASFYELCPRSPMPPPSEKSLSKLSEKQREKKLEKLAQINAERAGKPMKVTSRNTYVNRVISFLAWLYEAGKIPARLGEDFEFNRIEKPSREAFADVDLVNRLIENCPLTNGIGERDLSLKFVLFAGFHAGLRKTEIIMARPEWFDFKSHAINVPIVQELEGREFRPKSKRGRSIPLSPEFCAFLTDELRLDATQPYVLHPEKNSLRYRWDFQKPFERYMAQMEVPWITAHTMRHSFASNLARADISLHKVAIWLGDRLETTERHYTHLVPKHGELRGIFTPAWDPRNPYSY